jgi:hypothetical protein
MQSEPATHLTRHHPLERRFSPDKLDGHSQSHRYLPMRHRLVWNNDLELVLGKTNDETPTMRDVPPKAERSNAAALWNEF